MGPGGNWAVLTGACGGLEAPPAAAWGAARWAAAEGTVVRGGSGEGREGAAGWTAGGARPWGPHVCLLEESPVLKRLRFALDSASALN